MVSIYLLLIYVMGEGDCVMNRKEDGKLKGKHDE
jgi:hypothetical protein